ncbi:MAG: hypothetical protein NT106_12815, partial [Candidatus Sumerlaeota bacterium]|nr:hypothetical protein [Candidatus Sumerlaeota bacterium]
MKILFVSVGKEEYLFQRQMAYFLEEKKWEARFVTLGNYNVDYKEPPKDTTVIEREDPRIFSTPLQTPSDCEERIRHVEQNFGIPCLRRLFSTDRIHRDRLKSEKEYAFLTALYFEFWDKFFSSHSFDIGFMEHGGELIRWSAYYQCHTQGIPFYQVFFCPIPDRIFLLKNMDYNIKGVDWQAKENISPEEKEEWRVFLSNIRESKIDFVKIHRTDFHWSMPFLFLRAYYRKLFTNIPGYKKARLWNYTKDHFWKITRKHFMKLLYSKPMKGEKYVFFPLHHNDDAQLLIRAPQYANQFALIEILANALPYGYKLYIKEHPALIGGFSYRMLRDLKNKCPNIRIINPLHHPHKLIKDAAAVATINSTTGFEAILFRKPLMIFGKTFFRGTGFSTD